MTSRERYQAVQLKYLLEMAGMGLASEAVETIVRVSNLYAREDDKFMAALEADAKARQQERMKA